MTNMYFFHNIYGDEEHLLQTLPTGVTAVPFGWTPEVEAERNRILSDLNTSVSSLPSLLVFIPEHFFFIDKNYDMEMLNLPQDHRSYGLQKAPDKWVEFSFLSIPKPWTWEKMLALVTSYHSKHE